MNELKKKLVKEIEKILIQRIQTAKVAISEARESGESETKSTVGDKYETARALIHLEEERLSGQLQTALDAKKEFERMDFEVKYDIVDTGSMVTTTQGIYLIGLGLGAVTVEGQKLYAISLNSPIGTLLFEKKVGDKVTFRDQVIEIKEIC